MIAAIGHFPERTFVWHALRHPSTASCVYPAPASGGVGGNGVFIACGSSDGCFPSETDDDANYWVDVVFVSGS